MITTETPSTRITEQVTAWPGVETAYGRRGELAFKVGRRELGHLHGDRTAHFAFPKQVWFELREQKRIDEHPVFPGKAGPAARSIDGAADVREIVALMRLNYERIVADPSVVGDSETDTDGPGRPRDLDYGGAAR